MHFLSDEVLRGSSSQCIFPLIFDHFLSILDEADWKVLHRLARKVFFVYFI